MTRPYFDLKRAIKLSFEEVYDAELPNAFERRDDAKGGMMRRRPRLYARQAFYYFANKRLGISFSYLGKLCNRDHTTVLHSANRFKDLTETRWFGRDLFMDFVHRLQRRLDQHEVLSTTADEPVHQHRTTTRAWSDREHTIMMNMLNGGRSAREISLVINRSITAIYGRADRLGVYFPRGNWRRMKAKAINDNPHIAPLPAISEQSMAGG